MTLYFKVDYFHIETNVSYCFKCWNLGDRWCESFCPPVWLKLTETLLCLDIACSVLSASSSLHPLCCLQVSMLPPGLSQCIIVLKSLCLVKTEWNQLLRSISLVIMLNTLSLVLYTSKPKKVNKYELLKNLLILDYVWLEGPKGNCYATVT